MSTGKPWTFHPQHRIMERLKNEPLPQIADVIAALLRILDDPWNPADVPVQPFQVEVDVRRSLFDGERTIAFLPHDFYLTYIPVDYAPRPPLVYNREVIVESFARTPRLRL